MTRRTALSLRREGPVSQGPAPAAPASAAPTPLTCDDWEFPSMPSHLWLNTDSSVLLTKPRGTAGRQPAPLPGPIHVAKASPLHPPPDLFQNPHLQCPAYTPASVQVGPGALISPLYSIAVLLVQSSKTHRTEKA